MPKKVSRQLGRAILEFVLDRAGQTTYSVKKWCLPETSKYLKIIPQSRSPGQNNIFAYVTVCF